MRVAIVTESFPPDVNGVAHCALQTARHLHRRGHHPLVIAPAGPGEGPADPDASRPYPVLRGALAALQASADAVLAPGPAETFGLAALEALACGTPVVVSELSALPALVGPAGATAADRGAAFADAVEHVLSRPEPTRRATARTRAERYGWPAAVAAFLAAHDAPPAGGAVSDHAPPAQGATMAG